VAQNAILLFFPLNFNFCRKKSAAKFPHVKTSSGKVVATSFLYLTVHRWNAGDVPIYLANTVFVLGTVSSSRAAERVWRVADKMFFQVGWNTGRKNHRVVTAVLYKMR